MFIQSSSIKNTLGALSVTLCVYPIQFNQKYPWCTISNIVCLSNPVQSKVPLAQKSALIPESEAKSFTRKIENKKRSRNDIIYDDFSDSDREDSQGHKRYLFCFYLLLLTRYNISTISFYRHFLTCLQETTF